MERYSYFIQDKALFGSFPTQEQVNILEEHGVRCFIDLTSTDECKTTPYITRYKYIKYPIPDRKIPEDWKSFAQLVVEICNIIKALDNGKKIVIHCKGGHGRSGVLVACILAHFHGIPAEEALRQTNHYHSKRQEMREKWRKIGSPQGKKQKDFVHKFFRPLRYGKTEHENILGFDNTTPHPVTIPGVGTFANAFLAFQAYRAPNNKEYINKLLNGQLCPEYVTEHTREWEEKKIHYMAKVLEYKFRQHDELRNNLVNTGLRPLTKCSPDTFWSDGGNKQGKNIHGRLMSKLRAQFLHEEFDKMVERQERQEQNSV